MHPVLSNLLHVKLRAPLPLLAQAPSMQLMQQVLTISVRLSPILGLSISFSADIWLHNLTCWCMGMFFDRMMCNL